MDNRSRHEDWSVVLSIQSTFGLSKKTFCTEQGINPRTFYYWQRRLQDLEQADQHSVIIGELRDRLIPNGIFENGYIVAFNWKNAS
jgi:hypothetical protein